MFGILRYSFTIFAFLCAVALGGERAVGQVVPIPTGAPPQEPDGFSVELVTSALRKPRVIREAPNGDLFVADSMFNAVHVLRIPPGGAKPSRDEVFASGLKQPFGIAFYPLGSDPQWVYIASSDGVVRFRYRNGQLKATGKPERIVAGVPTTHHYARDIAFSADGRRLFFSVGSGSNAARDMFPEPHLAMLPTHRQILATGLRNCEGMTVQPATGELWCVVNERDELDENFPPEYKGSAVVNKDDRARHIQVVLNGMQGARAGGVVYASAMPPFAGVPATPKLPTSATMSAVPGEITAHR